MRYDLIILGAGPGGHAAAIEAASLGRKVMIVERKDWGGTCTHRGCIPTKALLACSRRYQDIRNAKRLGVATGGVTFDFATAKRHQHQLVKLAALGVRKSLQDMGVDCLEGEGFITEPGEIEIHLPSGERQRSRTDNIVIAWGSEVSPLAAFSFSRRVLSSDTLLEMNHLPESLIIIGGGAIGIEWATFLSEVGVKVTVIELMPQILPYEDPDIAAFLTGELQKKGVVIHTAATVRRITEKDAKVSVQINHRSDTIEVAAEHVLISTGRRPSLRQEELDRLGIAYQQQGLTVDPALMTSVPSIFAVGDVTGGILLAHRAAAQGRALARSLFTDSAACHNDDTVPVVVYSHPPVARVGMTETKAREHGLNVNVRKKDYGANILARTELVGNGFVKSLYHRDRIVGAAVAGEQAPDLIAVLSLAVAARLNVRNLENWVIPHPTLSELLDFRL